MCVACRAVPSRALVHNSDASCRPNAALEDNVWYYRDRAGLPRGPCQLSTLRACWVNAIIDEFTIVWGQGLEAWYPIHNVVGLTANIQSYDGAAAAYQHDS